MSRQRPPIHSDRVPRMATGGTGRCVDATTLRRSYRKQRTLFSACCTGLTIALFAAAVFPLFSVLVMLIYRGIAAFDWAFFTETAPYAMQETGGGIGNAIAGSLTMVAIAVVLSVPPGLLAAIYLAEVGPNTRLASATRFAAKVLTGLPSIIAGVFVFGLLVLQFGSFSAWAGGAALAILMLPMIMLTAEEAIKMVPAKMREAAYGMGCTQAQTVARVLLPTALPGILTGIMLAIARALGETAPLLFTAQYAPQSWIWEGRLRLNSATQSLAVFIYENAGSPFDNLDQMAWGAALVLVGLVLLFNLAGQSIAWRYGQHRH
jgi:phosphate transport system permease protein